METCQNEKFYQITWVIANYGLGSKVLKIAKKTGVKGGTIVLGRGTVKSRLLEFLDLSDIRKEIVIIISEEEKMTLAMQEINKELKLCKPNHGIAFTAELSGFLGTKNYNYRNNEKSGDVKEQMYNSIFVIVDKGKGETVMEVATESGARGGTIINARGSGIHETSKLFYMDIEPEKEIVVILTEKSMTEKIALSIRDKLDIDKPGNGIIFIHNVGKTYGIS